MAVLLRRGRALTLAVAAIAVCVGAAALATRSTPVIEQIRPAVLVPSTIPQVIAISGREFQAGLRFVVRTPVGVSLEFTGEEIRAQTESSFKVAMVLELPGTYSLVVTNPDGGMSPPFEMEVTRQQSAFH